MTESRFYNEYGKRRRSPLYSCIFCTFFLLVFKRVKITGAPSTLCRSAAALANNALAFNSIDDGSGSNGIDDDDTGSNGTFNCSNSLRKAGTNSAIQRSDIIDRWKSNYKRLRPSY